MIKIKTADLAKELKELDSRIELVPNANRPGLSNFKLAGVDMFPVPAEDMQDEHTPDYIYVFPNGMSAPMKTYEEAKGLALTIIERLKDPAYSADFFDTQI